MLDRVPGSENLYIGSMFVLASETLLDNHNITHILSVLQRTEADRQAAARAKPRERKYVDIDDVEDVDFLVHFPSCVRFIATAFPAPSDSSDLTTSTAQTTRTTPTAPTAVFVHCAMGKSRSATAVIAYLLWRHPERFRSAEDEDKQTRDLQDICTDTTIPAAVTRALALVREARSIVEPNAGFMRQLALWWRMGCPADSDDAVEEHPVYQRWSFQKNVQESVAIGRAPERLWFSDEAAAATAAAGLSAPPETTPPPPGSREYQLRCKKCRRTVTTSAFVQDHASATAACPHYFVEPLSWMRPTLEQGLLDGRLHCPNESCGASLGRYAWQGFQCSCRAWVCPAFSLQRSKVDEMRVATFEASAASLGIRLPPGLSGRGGNL